MSARHEFDEFVHTVAERYRTKGYRVSVRPKATDLPAFLKGTSPDLLASRAGEHVAVGIHRLGSVRGGPGLRKLADLIESRPGWRFDVVLYEPEARRETRLPSESVIKRSMDRAERLFEQGERAASLLLAWSAMEAAARRALRDLEDDGAKRRVSEDLLKTLVSSGLLREVDFRRLVPVMRLRNEVAHGQLQSNVSKEVIGSLRDATKQLLEGFVPTLA
jgi:HEPN domain-containing protein